MSAKKNSGDVRCLSASTLHCRRIRGWRICSSACFLAASWKIIARTASRFKSPLREKMPNPNLPRSSCLTSSRSTSWRATASASKNLAAGRISLRQSQKVLLPVEIPPVIPIAGMNDLKPQNPKPKTQKIPNLQILNQCFNRSILTVGAWDLVGAWQSEFGISPQQGRITSCRPGFPATLAVAALPLAPQQLDLAELP